MRSNFGLPVVFAIFFVTAACVEPPDDEVSEPLDENEPGVITPLYGDRPALYGVIEVGNTWTKDNLTVCWMDEIFDSEQHNVPSLVAAAENAVMGEWHRVGRIRFNSAPWPRCSDQRSDIRIGFENRPNIAGESQIGTDALGIPDHLPTMTLNFGVEAQPCPSTGRCPRSNPPPRLPTADTISSFQNTALHEFGHALGLRHEHVHERSDCEVIFADGTQEQMDEGGFDGESVFAFDRGSVMSYCSGATKLAPGDIRALHTLYPGVVGLYANAELGHGANGLAQPLLLGPGYFTSATIPSLTTISSIVVPPGYQVRICSTTQCAAATTNRDLSTTPYDNAIVNIEIVPMVIGSDAWGYQGTTEVFGETRDAAQFTVLADNTMSSVFPAPTRAARVCTGAGGTGICSPTFTGGSIPDALKLGPAVNNEVSHIEVTKRVISYTNRFTGSPSAFPIGVFKASTTPNFPTDIKTLAIWGLEVRACTLEGLPSPVSLGGAGDCRTYTQSADLAAAGHGPIRFLHVREPMVTAP